SGKPRIIVVAIHHHIHRVAGILPATIIAGYPITNSPLCANWFGGAPPAPRFRARPGDRAKGPSLLPWSGAPPGREVRAFLKSSTHPDTVPGFRAADPANANRFPE